MKRTFAFYIQYILFIIYSKVIFKAERFFYKKFGNKNIKRRIFLSSGNISLINVLTIIKQFPSENCEDILVIDTVSGKKEFFDINLKAASGHNFKKIILFKSSPDDRIYFEFMKKNIFKIDEIYAHVKLDYMRFLQPMFPDCRFIMFDEGMGSLIEQYHPNNKNITELQTMNYCEKLDRLGFDNIPSKNLDTRIFKEIAEDLGRKYPFDLEISPDSKTVMFCGAYWNGFNMGKEGFYNYQNGIMQKLLDRGFDVIYKPHPRDEVDFPLPQGVRITNCLLPLELYNLDLLAIVSIASTASLHPYHYWKIAGFCDISEKTIYNKEEISFLDINRKILDLYLPNVSELLNINAKEFSKAELKEKINGIFENKLTSQPKLSENKLLREYYERFREQESKKFRQ